MKNLAVKRKITNNGDVMILVENKDDLKALNEVYPHYRGVVDYTFEFPYVVFPIADFREKGKFDYIPVDGVTLNDMQKVLYSSKHS